MPQMIECSNCGKLIEKKGKRTMCIKCRNVADKIRIAAMRDKEYFKEYYKKKKESLK